MESDLNLTPRSSRNYGRLALLESPVIPANCGPDSGSPSLVDTMKRLDHTDDVRDLVHYSHEQGNLRIKRDSALSEASDTTVATVTTWNLQGRKFLVGPNELGNDLGDGASGCVRMARNKVTGHNVTVKIIDKTGPGEVIREKKFNLSQRLSHEQRRYRGEIGEGENRAENDPTSFHRTFIVLEYVSGGNYSLTSKRKVLCKRQRPFNNNVKIVDFGMTTLEPRGHWLKSRCGTPPYAAPEIMMAKFYKSSKAGIWSCGIILFELQSGSLLFSNSSNNILTHILFDGYKIPEYLSPGLKDLTTRLLVVNPDDRITIPEIWRHPVVLHYAPINSLMGEEIDRGPQVPNIEEMA
ncbi:serine/threonine protein kinase [Rhizina undulata]